MLTKLPQIIVMILSIFLAFYCVDFHKDTILSILKVEENTTTTQTVLKKENRKNIVVETEVIMVKEHQIQKAREAEGEDTELYVESLAIHTNEENISNMKKLEEVPVAKEVVVNQEQSRVEHQVESVVEDSITQTEQKVVSESSKGYALDDLEKMILEELKNRENR